ncbi:nuclear transport factor 2 family protein [Cryobacterium aureum]|uniref:nuclear transport factor 2 family protein n=1 Tax=Cryobacterium aureum TaxID=995037 RepID=UPI00196A4D99|nr:nuclear transport factor 2 family protein [Cryobacterium aureum]
MTTLESTSLESRIRRLEDRGEIHDLAVRYFLASDFDDYDAIAASFAETSSFAAGGFEGAAGGAGIASMIKGARTAFGTTIHTPHYVLIDFQDEDHATGLVGAHLEIAVGGTSVFGAVRYEDEYLRENDRWVFAKRNMRTIHVGDWADVQTSLTSETPVRWPGGAPAASNYPPTH